MASSKEQEILNDYGTPPSTPPSQSWEVKETSFGIDLSLDLPQIGTPTPITSTAPDNDSGYIDDSSESSIEVVFQAVFPIKAPVAPKSFSHSYMTILDDTIFPPSPPLTPPNAESKTAGPSPFTARHTSSGYDAKHDLKTPPSTPLRRLSEASPKSSDVFSQNVDSKTFQPTPAHSTIKFSRKVKVSIPVLASYAPSRASGRGVKTTFLTPCRNSVLTKHDIPSPTPPTEKRHKPTPNYTALQSPRKPIKCGVAKAGLLTIPTMPAKKTNEARRQASPCPTTFFSPITLATRPQTPPTSPSKSTTPWSPIGLDSTVPNAQVEAASPLKPEATTPKAPTLCDGKYSQNEFLLTHYAPSPTINEELEAGTKEGWGRKSREPSPLELSRAKRRIMLRKLSYGMGEEVKAAAKRPRLTKQHLELERERARGYGLGIWETKDTDAETLIAYQLEHMKLYFAAGSRIC